MKIDRGSCHHIPGIQCAICSSAPLSLAQLEIC
jgi:hypothetical protein